MKKYVVLLLVLSCSLSASLQAMYCDRYTGCAAQENSMFGRKPLYKQFDVGSAFKKDTSELDYGPDQVL